MILVTVIKNYVILAKFLNLFEPHFTLFLNWENNTYLSELLWKAVMVYLKHPE